jgi:quercetin dioxygenase-like cupin family protein
MTYRHGDRVGGSEPGDSVFFDANAPHGSKALAELPSTCLSIVIHERE